MLLRQLTDRKEQPTSLHYLPTLSSFSCVASRFVLRDDTVGGLAAEGSGHELPVLPLADGLLSQVLDLTQLHVNVREMEVSGEMADIGKHWWEEEIHKHVSHLRVM